MFENTKPDRRIITEKTFGPVVRAQRFDDGLDCIAKEANDKCTAALRAWERGAARKLAQRIRSGTVRINSHNVFDASLPLAVTSGRAPRGVRKSSTAISGSRRLPPPCRAGIGDVGGRSRPYSPVDIATAALPS